MIGSSCERRRDIGRLISAIFIATMLVVWVPLISNALRNT
jgi:hypothetical protein